MVVQVKQKKKTKKLQILKLSSIIRFFYGQRFFSTQPQCCLTFSWIELQMLLRCCLAYISIIRVKHFLYVPYLCPGLDLSLFMSYLCDQVFIFIMINRIYFIQTHLFLCLVFWMSYYLWAKNVNNFQIAKVQS